MQTTSKDGPRGASTPPPPPATNGNRPQATASTDDKKSRAKRKWFVISKKDGKISEFDTKPLALRWLNTDPEAPLYGEFEIIVGNKVAQRQTVSLA